MKAETYTALLKDLQKLQKVIVSAQVEAVRRDARLAAWAERKHAEAEVGGRLDEFVATTARRSTVLFLLRTVFVRVLEDLGLLEVRRLRGEWGWEAFREVAPALGRRAYLGFVFRDLAVDFPALFAPGDDELPLPDEDGCRAVWNLWHHPNKDGVLYEWNGDGFDSRFLGDLYQDLDADIRKRYALLQTPRFVERYILDHTLTPALAEFDPAALREQGETFRVLDPTCGSGHFLIGSFHRLADYWRDRHGLSEVEASERALEGVWGCDINPHAVEIAEFRLLLEFVARTGVKDLARLARLALNLRAMDSLIPWERAGQQGEMFAARDRLEAYGTARQRKENAAFLRRAFHVVVGNPPYISPKDVRKRDDYRTFWPNSAAGKYALSAPFAERFFAIGVPGGFNGQITSNSFMKREFGRKLVTSALPRFDLQAVIDASGVRIPGYGTPTVILFGRNRRPAARQVWAVLGKRGEPKRSGDPALGSVWHAIATAEFGEVSDDSPFLTTGFLEASVFHAHPWSIGGGEARGTKEAIESVSTPLSGNISQAGIASVNGCDDVFLIHRAHLRVRPSEDPRVVLSGDQIRDFALLGCDTYIPWLYTSHFEPIAVLGSLDAKSLGPWRTVLSSRKRFGRPMIERGLKWYEWQELYPDKLRTPLTIVFAEVATHSHFMLDRRGLICSRTAPVIKLPAAAGVDDHLDLLGLLNSSVLEFWGKQVFHCKGGPGGAKISSDEFENFYQRDTTKLQQAPITSRDRDARIALARALDATAQERAACLPAALLAAGAWSPSSMGADLSAARDRYHALTNRMVALQEELDWLTYASYGLIDPVETVAPDAVEPLAPGHRPFEIAFARQDDEADDDEKSAWWSRHGHDRVTEIPEHYSEAHRDRIQQRLDAIASDPRIALLETPPYKRRWQLADWPSACKDAAESWLLDRLEDLFAPASDTAPAGPLAAPKPWRLEEIVAAWQRDPRVAAVAGVWTGTGLSVDLALVAEKLLKANALPDNPLRVYTDEGQRKLAEWKRTWALQDQEDAWEAAAAKARAAGEPSPKKRLVDPDDPGKVLDAIPLPPKFDKGDFVRAEYFSTRGKLNVPRERFVLFADLVPPRFGWNGWRDTQRTLAQVEAYTLAENDPHDPLPAPTSDDPRRCGVTYGLWESLPDVRRWGGAGEHAELESLAKEACRQPRCPCPVVEAWKGRLAGKRAEEAPRRGRRPAQGPSLAERAWVAGLFDGAPAPMATLWERHQARVAQPDLLAPAPAEAVALTEPRLAVVLDDLVASGDLDVTGRGQKKRYTVVTRGVSP